jgi:hypothetical protein
LPFWFTNLVIVGVTLYARLPTVPTIGANGATVAFGGAALAPGAIVSRKLSTRFG